MDDKYGLANWQDLGLELGIPGGELWKIKDPSGDSPSGFIFKKLETLRPDLRITTIKAAFAREELNLPVIVQVLSVLPGMEYYKTFLAHLHFGEIGFGPGLLVFARVSDAYHVFIRSVQRRVCSVFHAVGAYGTKTEKSQFKSTVQTKPACDHMKTAKDVGRTGCSRTCF